MESLWIDSYLAAFLGGLATSVHCAGMCGPLSCGVLCKAKHSEEAFQVALLYHLFRLISYGLIGAIIGWFGEWAYNHFYESKNVIAVFIIASLLFTILYYIRGKIIPLQTFHKVCSTSKNPSSDLDVYRRSILLGLFTPFIPCGALYFLYSLLSLTASPIQAASFAITFGLGTIPLLMVSQLGIWKLRERIKPLSLAWLQRGFLSISLFLISWRVIQYDAFNEFFCK